MAEIMAEDMKEKDKCDFASRGDVRAIAILLRKLEDKIDGIFNDQYLVNGNWRKVEGKRKKVVDKLND